MRLPQFDIRRTRGLFLGLVFAFGLVSVVSGQSQEPKPQLPATSPTPPPTSGGAAPATGVSGNSWRGPTWGVSVSWDPDVWSVQDEFLTRGFDGLLIGTDLSSVYIEAFDGFAGDPGLCLAAAAQQIRERDREHVIDVTPVSGQPLPTAETANSARQLYGVTLKFDDGTSARTIEFIECRTLVPGIAVLQLSWQTLTESFDEELPKVEALFAAVEVPGAAAGAATPAAPAESPLMATPIA